MSNYFGMKKENCKKVGQCKLCQKKDIVLVKGHIVPDFLYQRIKEKGLLKVYVQKNPRAKSFAELTSDVCGTGWYDYMFCKNCDCVVLQNYEDYAAPIVKSLFEMDDSQFPHGMLYGEEIKYGLFKRFFLSILYKAAVQKLQNLKAPDLGKKYTDEIRLYLLDSNLDIPEGFCPVLLFWVPKHEQASQLIEFPFYHYDKNLRVHSYMFMMGELMMYCSVTTNQVSLAMSQNMIKENGTCNVTIHNGAFAQKTMDMKSASLAKTKYRLKMSGICGDLRIS